MNRRHLAIIGSGASAIYLLKHLTDEGTSLALERISIFEKCSLTGMGMPYNPRTTDRYNMSNISSDELPELVIPLVEWLRSLDDGHLGSLDIRREEIDSGTVYSRIALGQYLHSQYEMLLEALRGAGIRVDQHPGCEITDIHDLPAENRVKLTTVGGKAHFADLAVIATGHCWAEVDRPEIGYFASPWPICKLLPADGETYNFRIGTLGASLSAFDVVTSLAHRHGRFTRNDDGLTYQPNPGTEQFHLAMHSANGLLPHLQYDQEEALREIYRHVDREGLLALIDDDGHLRIEHYYNEVCRPALRDAFLKDDLPAMAARMEDPEFHLKDFVEAMAEQHDYENAFEGMRHEMKEARRSVDHHRPIHWKETMDDLIYTLNYHAELMPAEDHLTLRSVVMPFLMNVIAAMPIESGETLLALHDAGVLSLVPGRASLAENQEEPGVTHVEVDDDGETSTLRYRMFVDCSGQKPLELEDFPFPGLVEDGSVRRARAPFVGRGPDVPEPLREHVFETAQGPVFAVGGIDIDAAFRVIGEDGRPNPRIHDIAFPHTSGVRPYSYGLQACDATSAILVRAWVEALDEASEEPEVEDMTRIYDEVRPTEDAVEEKAHAEA